jgi:hypothetical protein
MFEQGTKVANRAIPTKVAIPDLSGALRGGEIIAGQICAAACTNHARARAGRSRDRAAMTLQSRHKPGRQFDHKVSAMELVEGI